MPTTITPSTHLSRPWINPPPAISSTQLLERSCREEYGNCKNVIQSSFTDFPSTPICGADNGFVRACFNAYSNHHRLTLRPEDIWFAILSQLTFHVNAHAEELRSFFVTHEGQKELEVIEYGTIKSVDFGPLAVHMTAEMDKHVVDPDLRSWIMPDFSTTTHTDTVTAAVLMMGAMQKYFSYKMTLCCGIPSVTLLGEREDWVKIRRRLEMLPKLGREPEIFARLLEPVLDHFVRSFDVPDDAEVRTFWSKIAHRQRGGSGSRYLSGWLTAFCFWDAEGKCLYDAPTGAVDMKNRRRGGPGCDIDGVLYHRVNTNDIPKGYVSVPVTVDDNGTIYKTRILAGSVGIQISSSGLPVDESQLAMYGPGFGWGPNGETTNTAGATGPGHPLNLDTLQPVSGWWMYELLNDAEGASGERGLELNNVALGATAQEIQS